ncbi:MAG: UvrD-helicase domain-containing protein, partial [Clostridia bacterium]|nr:UvrD-helicase domain-containing protein [Clostridia bacterium]
MSNKPTPTPEQQRVIDQRNSNLLVSASAGTGKTTVMIERLTKLIAEGANVQDFVVVTYTKLAASEMKKKLADSLSKLSDNAHVSRQLELLDNASISTIHSFCTDLLRNYFYVVDIDPSFAILDSMTLKNLANEAIDNVINQYVAAKDEMFAKVYKIYATKRRRENFIAVVNQLYEFSRNVVDFPTWYNDKKQQMLSAGKDNIVICTVFDSIKEQMSFFERQYLSFRNLSGELDGIFDD